MKIETGKKYLTRDGRVATVLSTSIKNGVYPVAFSLYATAAGGETVATCTEGGHFFSSSESSEADLVAEYSEWNNVTVDTPVYVRDDENKEWKKRHFAKYENGEVYTFCDGRTSFTAKGVKPISWKYAKLATEEDK